MAGANCREQRGHDACNVTPLSENSTSGSPTELREARLERGPSDHQLRGCPPKDHVSHQARPEYPALSTPGTIVPLASSAPGPRKALGGEDKHIWSHQATTPWSIIPCDAAMRQGRKLRVPALWCQRGLATDRSYRMGRRWYKDK